MKKVLIIAPHGDDGELGCGATISRFIEEKNEVHHLAFTCVAKSDEKKKIDTTKEVEDSMINGLGIKPEHLFFSNMEIREFHRDRQVILDFLIKLNRINNYDMIFTPSLSDTHQDHIVVAQESLRTFKKATILGYELPWNNFSFHSNCFVVVDRKHVDKKINALSKYVTQLHRDYMNPDFILSWASTRGVQINRKYAEIFEVMRWII